MNFLNLALCALKRDEDAILKKYLSIALVLLISVLAIFYQWFNGLSSDEEMLEVFNRHKHEIRALMKEFREWEGGQNKAVWSDQEKVRTSLDVAEIKRMRLSAPIWHPQPYSYEEAKRILADGDARNEMCGANLSLCSTVVVDIYQGSMPDKFYRHITLSGIHILYKDIVHFPVPPKIDGDKLRLPINIYSKSSEYARVDTVLDEYSGLPERGKCVYRKIDDYWFLRLCNADI